MKAIIKIGKVEVKFDVPLINDISCMIQPQNKNLAATSINERDEFMHKAKRIAISLYRETKKDK